MFYYVAMVILGFAITHGSSLQDMEFILVDVGPITITAFVASLAVSFAMFARTEWLQRWMVQYAIVPMFGVFLAMAWQRHSMAGVFVIVASGATHFGFWTSSCQSRVYRLEQYSFGGFNTLLPYTTRVIARLNGVGEAQVADLIVKAILRDEPIPDVVLNDAEVIVGKKAITALRQEHLTNKE